MSLGKGFKKAKRSPALLEGLENRTLLSGSQLIAAPSLIVSPDVNASSIAGYTPAQIRAAYGFTSVQLNNGAAGTGSGQTIAIIDAYGDPDISSDLSTFDSQFGLSAASLKVESETGSTTALPAANAGWDLETSLDVEWAHTIAPGASILLVEANSASLSDLLTAVNYARNVSSVSVVSMSWGSSEFSNETAYDSYFTTPAGHQGETFVAASGDEGSWYGPEWPATSPNVLSVGGTTLNLANSSGTYAGETGWADSTGGISNFEREPTYQTDVQRTGAETSPDVSYDANPSTGFAVYDSVNYEGDQGWWDVGGTSAGAPQWASLVAIADQGRAVKSLTSLNGSSQTLPLLFSLYNSTQYNQAFHDETSGASSWYYSAAAGYDAVTGLGSPKAPYVIQELIGASAAGTQSATTTAATVLTTARPAGHRNALMGNPPSPVAIAAVIPVTLTPTTTPPGSSASISLLGSATTNFPAAHHQGISTAATQNVAASSNFGTVTNMTSGAFSQTSGSNATWHAFLDDFRIGPAVSIIGHDIASMTGAFHGAKTMSSVVGTSTNVVEGLLISNALALAHVANTLAGRLSDENSIIWQETVTIAGIGILAAGHFARGRHKDLQLNAKRRNAKFLCVGE